MRGEGAGVGVEGGAGEEAEGEHFGLRIHHGWEAIETEIAALGVRAGAC